jgi:dihydrofolate synthase/folylpolyglutamate synthase
MTYDEALAYLHAFPDFERGTAGEEILTLDRMRRLLELLDHPDRAYGIVHVVGTKGKGSTAAMIASCLRAAGYRTGLFTSPHLVDDRERIRVDGALIPPDALAAIVDDTLRPAVDWLRAAGERTPLHFELQCALAFEHFRRAGVQIAVVEAGLGGRLDATNAVSTVAETVITTIGYDHMAVLGDTLERIAAEKAAVVRPSGRVVSAPQPPDALTVVERVCYEREAALSLVGRDWRVEGVVEHADDTVFDLSGPGTRYEELSVPLAGAHQAVNAAVAVAALSDLRRDYPRLDDAMLRQGLAATRWAGRLQTVARDPLIILDAAHNRESAAALAGALQRLYPGQSFVLVVAVFRDKSARDVLTPLLPLASHVVVTAADHPRALPSNELAATTRALVDEDREARLGRGFLVSPDRGIPKSRASGILIEEAPSVAAALERARTLAGPAGRVLVTGSLRTVGEAMVHLKIDATDN